MKFQKWRVAPACPQAAERLMAAGYPYLVSAVLARRGISSAEEAAAFLEHDREMAYSSLLM